MFRLAADFVKLSKPAVSHPSHAAERLIRNIGQARRFDGEGRWQESVSMEEASWGDAGSPEINWRMSAALENVPRGDEDLAEVTSLEGAVRVWLALDIEHREAAILTPEHPILVDGATVSEFSGVGIETLALRLPHPGRSGSNDDPGDDYAA